MPLLFASLGYREHDTLAGVYLRWTNGVESCFTPALEHPSLRLLILDNKMIWMNFDKNIIVFGEFVSGKEVFGDVGNMKYVVKRKRFGSSI